MNSTRSSEGFILVLVLVVLVVLGLLAAAVATVSARAVREAQVESDAFQAEVDGVSTRDTLLYMLSTRRQTLRGLTIDDQVALQYGQARVEPGSADEPPSNLPIGNEIRLDSTPYQGLGDIVFALQDDAGRINPNWLPSLNVPGLSRLLGVAAQDWPGLEARLLDYQDPDELVRLGGAEAARYEELGLPPPPNATLRTPLQLRSVAGWHDALEGMDDAELMRVFTASHVSALNINTASATALETLPGVDADIAKRIVAMRDQSTQVLVWQFLSDFRLPMDQMDPVRLSAIGYGTLALWHNETGPVRLLHWTLTPSDEGGRPWRLDYEITLPRDQVADARLARPSQAPLLSAGPESRD